MALTNFKTQPVVDDIQHLMCSFPGCTFRWSVFMNGSRPMCSKHAWDDKNPVPRPSASVIPTTPPVKYWMNEEQF